MARIERGTIVRRARLATWCAVALLGAVARARPAFARPLAMALVATIGVAHGATDDSMLARIGVRPRGGRRTLSLAYGGAALATYAAACRAPRTAARALFALSWLHFGAGDAAFARACDGRSRTSVADAFVRGAVPLCIAGNDGRSRAVAALAAVRALRALGTGDAAAALDHALPAVMLLAVRPRLGFAIYFGAWHAVRHTALLLERDERGGGVAARAGRFARESLPNVVLAVVAGALARAVRARAAATPADDEATFGALILAITVPHQLAVWRFERHHAA